MLVIKDKTVKNVTDLSILDEVVNRDTLCLTSVCCCMAEKDAPTRIPVREKNTVSTVTQHV